MNLAESRARHDRLYTVLRVFIAFLAFRGSGAPQLANAAIAKECCNRHQPVMILKAVTDRGGSPRTMFLLPRTITVALTTPKRSVKEMTPGLGDLCLDISE